MLGTVLISGLLLGSPDTTTGFTLVPKHTVFLDRAYPSFSEIVAAREGVYDLGVGSIHIPLEDGTFQLAIIVYGSEQAQLLQYQRVENYLQRNLQSVELASHYFGTPFGSLRYPIKIDAKTDFESIPEPIASVIDRDEAILDSILNAENRVLALTSLGFDSTALGIINAESEINVSSITTNNGILPLDLSQRNIGELLSSSEKNGISLTNSSESVLEANKRELPIAKTEQTGAVPNLAPSSSKPNVPSTKTLIEAVPKEPTASSETIKPFSPEVKSTAKQAKSNTEDLVVPNQLTPKTATIPAGDQQIIAQSGEKKTATVRTPTDNQELSNRLPANQNTAPSKNKVTADLLTPKRKEGTKTAGRKPFREITIEPQEPGKYYIVFGHFDNKPNAQFYARSVRKTFDVIHLSPSNQGFRVLMLADQLHPVEQLKEIRLTFPKAWLSKPRKAMQVLDKES
jgi:hypothetical protein